MKAVIICNGSISDYSYYTKYLENTDLIICADGGAAHARRFGFKPHILLGDFDSVSRDDYEFFIDRDVEIVRYDRNKDFTDTEIAVETAVERGCMTVVIIGGLGSRFDHSLSNIMLLYKILYKGAAGVIVNEHNEIYLIRDKIVLKKDADARVSLIPVTGTVEGVTTEGLLYPLNNALFSLGTTWGISNEFTSDTAEITIKSGLMLVIKSWD